MPAAPSLLIVPYRSKTGKLYSQIPTSGAGDFTVTRNTTATRFNSAGLLESVASGIPRLDYYTSGGTAGCPALLVEPSGTNGIRNNSMVGASVSGNALPTNWIFGGVGLTQQIVEVGTENGVSYIDLRLSGTATGGTATLSFESTTQIAALTGQTWTISSYLKTIALPSPPTSFALAITERTSGGAIVTQQTANVSLTSTLARYSYSPTLNGGATTAFAQPRLFFTLVVGQAYDFTIRVGYPQMELGSVATSVIPTTTGSVTRNADVISVSGAVSGSIGQTEGTIYAEVDVRTFASSAARRIVNLRVDGSNLLSLEINDASTNIEFVATSGGVSVNAVASGLTAGITKIAVGYNSAASGTVLYVNGTLRDTKTIAIPNLSAAVFGLGVRGDGGAGTQLNDRIRAVALYTTRLSNAELATLTTP